MKFLPLVVRNLLRNTRRSLLTFVAIATSTFIFAVLISLPSMINQVLREPASAHRLMVRARGGMLHSLPEAHLNRIRAIPHVDVAAGLNLFVSYFREPRRLVGAVAVDHEAIEVLFPEWGISRAEAEELERDRTAALVGTAVMRANRWRVGERVTLRGTNYPVDVELTIVGTLDHMLARDNVLFRRDYLEELTGRPAIVNMFVVKVDRADAVPAVIASIDETFANSAAETETQSQAEFARSMLAEYRLLFDGFLVLAVIVMLAIGLVAANTAAMSVRERRSEIAVMRALGYPRSFVFGALLAEGLAVSVPAGLAGCAGAYGVTRVLPYASETLGPLVLNMMFPANVLIMSLAAATAIGVLASFVPAFNAVRRNIVEGLRPAG